MGVSIVLLLLGPDVVVVAVLALLEVVVAGGGLGRAKGFGGPWAPALKMALALGDGGGRITPDPPFKPPPPGPIGATLATPPTALPGFRGDEPVPVAASPSD